ncbi:MAG TPA: hypothetical protein DGB85_02475 [Deltaproteobacteria bacterium]|nr:hypothetical protein [Deltaproteobacteria bacterium]
MRHLYLPSVLGLGLLGSLLSWLVAQFVLIAAESLLSLPETTLPLLHHILEWTLLGSGLGMALQIREIYFQGSEIESLVKQGVNGLFDGLLLGLGMTLISLTFSERFPQYQFGGLLYAVLLGGGIGILTSRGCRAWKVRLQLALYAAIGGGGALYFLLTLQSVFLVQGFASWIPLLSIGFGISLLLGLPEALFNRSRLHLLTGEREGHVYWLHPFYSSLGYGLQNNLILHPFREVRGNQACIERDQGQMLLKNYGDSQEVLLNYRPVAQQELQSGDLIKIGTALLQFTK